MMQKQGIPAPGGIRVDNGDWLVPVQVGYESKNDIQALAYLAADNKLTALGGWDEPALAELLQEVAASVDVALESTGFSGDELDQLLQDLGSNFEGVDESEKSDGSLLALTDVTIDDPKTLVERGDVWKIKNHFLICADVVTEAELWLPFISKGCWFLPYPGTYAAMTQKAQENDFVMVQPSTYIAGHIIDKFVEVYGDDNISKCN